jgi:hypothetical protein
MPLLLRILHLPRHVETVYQYLVVVVLLLLADWMPPTIERKRIGRGMSTRKRRRRMIVVEIVAW